MQSASLLLAVLLSILVSPVEATPRVIDGPIFAELIEVRDGDTIKVRAHTWPGQFVEVYVRIRGIDTPELSGKCETEIEQAQSAKREVIRLLADQPIILTAIGGGKYFGRVLAHVESSSGTNLGRHLLKHGFAVPYRGGRRPDWCANSLVADSAG